MADPSLALHKAVLAVLKSGVSCPVYDAVPQGTEYPYVTINTSLSRNTDYLVERKQERFIFLSIWSEALGQEDIFRYIGEIDAAIHGVSLTLDTGSVVSVRVDESTTQRDADNVTYQGTVVLRIITEH